MTVQPSSPEKIESFNENIFFSSACVNAIELAEFPSGYNLKIPLEREFRLPDSLTITEGETHFFCDGWKYGEMGAFYVALHIAGNISRYYPDIWMSHIEQATTLALLIEQVLKLL